MTTLRLDLRLRDSASLAKVLNHLTRLGAEVTALRSRGPRVRMELEMPDSRAHRCVPQLRRLVEVTGLRELPVGDAVSA